MKKFFKRFIGMVSAFALCFSTSVVAMAQEVEKPTALELEPTAVVSEDASTYAVEVGSLVFSLIEFGNSSGTMLKSQGTKAVRLSAEPTYLTYLITTNGNHSNVPLRFGNGTQVTLVADGQTHTINIKSLALPSNQNLNCTYSGNNLISISLVFSK